jgi:hypothetical protein
MEVFSMKSSRGNRFTITSNHAEGHLDLTKDMGNRASLWSFLAFSWKPLDEVTLPIHGNHKRKLV